MSRSHKKALVTLAVGERYEQMFNRYCQKSWKSYCHKYAYDLIVITHPLDQSRRALERSAAWQKLLILSQEWSSQYEQVVWVDTDIMINPDISPDIAKIVPVDKVGAVESYSIPTRGIYTVALQRQYRHWRAQNADFVDNATPGQYYEARGIPGGDLDHVAHTGVLVCSPQAHRELFEHVYYHYEDEHKSPEWNYEMPALSYELVKNNLVEWLPEQFNFCVGELTAAFYPFLFENAQKPLIERVLTKLSATMNIGALAPKAALRRQCLKNIYELGYFIHFAGCSHLMEDLYQQIK
jgi:hypothetical protein